MGSKLTALSLGLLSLSVSLTAPVAVPIALLFTKRDAKALAWSWYDTPDEPDLFDLDMEAVETIYVRYGWFMAAWYWFGFRNRAHGFSSRWAEPAKAYWPREDGSYTDGDKFIVLRHFGPLRLEFGWPVYASTKFSTGLEFRPMVSVKWRPQ